MWIHAVLIFVGGGLGCVCRWLIATFTHHCCGTGFPYGTLAVNAVGCFAAGLVVHTLGEHLEVRADHSALLVVGFLGGFTTFSSFGRETLEMMVDGHLARAALNVLLMNTLCLGAVVAGYAVARAVWPGRA